MNQSPEHVALEAFLNAYDKLMLSRGKGKEAERQEAVAALAKAYSEARKIIPAKCGMCGQTDRPNCIAGTLVYDDGSTRECPGWTRKSDEMAGLDPDEEARRRSMYA